MPKLGWILVEGGTVEAGTRPHARFLTACSTFRFVSKLRPSMLGRTVRSVRWEIRRKRNDRQCPGLNFDLKHYMKKGVGLTVLDLRSNFCCAGHCSTVGRGAVVGARKTDDKTAGGQKCGEGGLQHYTVCMVWVRCFVYGI